MDGPPLSASRGIGLVSRRLSAKDLGVEGHLSALEGTISLESGVLRIKVDMISGRISNPLAIIASLTRMARSLDANELRIEAVLANERLANLLTRRYGMTSSGTVDAIVIVIEQESSI